MADRFPRARRAVFGQGGDGYVPGEGVGAVLLKPLSKAVADGDHIYGVIKATSINHGGKTNGYTVPNPKAQANVIAKVFEKTGIDLSIFSEGMREFGMSEVVYPDPIPSIYLQVAVAVFLTAFLGAIYPAWKAIRLKPVDALTKI